MARSRKLAVSILILIAAFFLSAATGWADIDPSTVQKLVAGDGATGDRFGSSVSINSDTAVIAAEMDDDNGENSGSAYVFVRNEEGTWSQLTKLLPDDGTADDRFGSDVSVSDDTMVVSASGDDDKRHTKSNYPDY